MLPTLIGNGGPVIWLILIAAAIAVVIITAVTAVGKNVSNVFDAISTAV